MRHTTEIKEKVRQLRLNGLSLNQIRKATKIPNTTIRSWISDIILSEKQLDVLRKRTHKALQEGRIKAQAIARKNRMKKEETLMLEGKKEIGHLSSREFLIAGIALYWAEGFKNRHEHRLGFCNSDPEMINFYIKWLKDILKVDKKDIVARLALNESYKDRVEEIEKYWSSSAGIPIDQFTKTFYQSSKWKKQFKIDNYHGVLRIHVKNSLDYLLKMRGWIEGLKATCYNDLRRPG